jgi:hypothetical protein
MKFKNLKFLSFEELMKQVPHNPTAYLWQKSLSVDNAFCKAVVSSGYLTWDQMIEAALAYRIGATRQGGVIFWQIGKDDYVNDGKVMYYRPDCHRDKARHPSWVSYMLSRRQKTPLTGAGARHCLFGTHLLAERRDVTTVAIVEAEKTAFILSQHYPQYIWLAAGGLTELTPQKLFPLRHHRIVLFPDTDPDQTAYTRWYTVAQEARRLYGLDIHVSSLLERRATAAQKQAKIDLVDFLF